VAETGEEGGAFSVFMYKMFRDSLAKMNSRFHRDFQRASSLYDGSSVAGTPEIKRLVRQTGVVLILFCVLFGSVALLLLLLVGRLFLLPIALSVVCLMGGIFQNLRGKMFLPEGHPPAAAAGGEDRSEANSASYAGDCPNCDRKAYWTGEKRVEDGRDYIGMKCSHCFNNYWLYKSDTAGV
jgi:hypothetical protein